MQPYREPTAHSMHMGRARLRVEIGPEIRTRVGVKTRVRVFIYKGASAKEANDVD